MDSSSHRSRPFAWSSGRASLLAAIAGIVVAAGACRGPDTKATSVAVLGTAASFAVLGGQTVTNTGPSTVDGDLGVWPGTAVVGFPPGLVTGGVIHAGDAVAMQAQSDLTVAYNSLAGTACNTDLTGQDLGGMTLTPGVYCFSSSAQLTGTLTLDAQGNPDALFVFQIASTLITASNATVAVINGAQSCNVYWQVGSSATLGTGTTFVGSIVALTSVTLDTGATVYGRALARNGSVTMDTNHLEIGTCVVAGTVDAATPPPIDGPTPPPIDAPTPPPIDAATPPPIDAAVCPYTQCGEVCTNTQEDVYNCGGCEINCTPGQECSAGVCVCPTANMCGNSCIDLDNNSEHCGACDVVCPLNQICALGTCRST